MPQIRNSGAVKIRALKSKDQPEWRRLWTGYLDFYFERLAFLARRQGG